MAAESQGTVSQAESLIIAGQLFLFVGLVALAGLMEDTRSLGPILMRATVVFATFGMSIYLDIRAVSARTRRTD